MPVVFFWGGIFCYSSVPIAVRYSGVVFLLGGSYCLLHSDHGCKCSSHLLDGLPCFLGMCSCNSAVALQYSDACLASLGFEGLFSSLLYPHGIFET